MNAEMYRNIQHKRYQTDFNDPRLGRPSDTSPKRKKQLHPEKKVISLINNLCEISARLTRILSEANDRLKEKGVAGCDSCRITGAQYKHYLKTIKILQMLVSGVLEKEQINKLDESQKRMCADVYILTDIQRQANMFFRRSSCCETEAAVRGVKKNDKFKHNLKCFLIILQKTVAELILQIYFFKSQPELFNRSEQLKIFNIPSMHLKIVNFEYTNLTDKIIYLIDFETHSTDSNIKKRFDGYCVLCAKEDVLGLIENLNDVLSCTKHIKLAPKKSKPDLKKSQVCCNRYFPHIHGKIYGNPVVLKFNEGYEKLRVFKPTSDASIESLDKNTNLPYESDNDYSLYESGAHSIMEYVKQPEQSSVKQINLHDLNLDEEKQFETRAGPELIDFDEKKPIDDIMERCYDYDADIYDEQKLSVPPVNVFKKQDSDEKFDIQDQRDKPVVKHDTFSNTVDLWNRGGNIKEDENIESQKDDLTDEEKEIESSCEEPETIDKDEDIGNVKSISSNMNLIQEKTELSLELSDTNSKHPDKEKKFETKAGPELIDFEENKPFDDIKELKQSYDYDTDIYDEQKLSVPPVNVFEIQDSDEKFDIQDQSDKPVAKQDTSFNTGDPNQEGNMKEDDNIESQKDDLTDENFDEPKEIESTCEEPESKIETFDENKETVKDTEDVKSNSSNIYLSKEKTGSSLELRDTNLKHPDKEIEKKLNEIGADKILSVVKPADCSEVNTFLSNIPSNDKMPYEISLHSLPLNEQDTEYIAQKTKNMNTIPETKIRQDTYNSLNNYPIMDRKEDAPLDGSDSHEQETGLYNPSLESLILQNDELQTIEDFKRSSEYKNEQNRNFEIRFFHLENQPRFLNFLPSSLFAVSHEPSLPLGFDSDKSNINVKLSTSTCYTEPYASCDSLQISTAESFNSAKSNTRSVKECTTDNNEPSKQINVFYKRDSITAFSGSTSSEDLSKLFDLFSNDKLKLPEEVCSEQFYEVKPSESVCNSNNQVDQNNSLDGAHLTTKFEQLLSIDNQTQQNIFFKSFTLHLIKTLTQLNNSKRSDATISNSVKPSESVCNSNTQAEQNNSLDGAHLITKFEQLLSIDNQAQQNIFLKSFTLHLIKNLTQLNNSKRSDAMISNSVKPSESVCNSNTQAEQNNSLDGAHLITKFEHLLSIDNQAQLNIFLKSFTLHLIKTLTQLNNFKRSDAMISNTVKPSESVCNSNTQAEQNNSLDGAHLITKFEQLLSIDSQAQQNIFLKSFTLHLIKNLTQLNNSKRSDAKISNTVTLMTDATPSVQDCESEVCQNRLEFPTIDSVDNGPIICPNNRIRSKLCTTNNNRTRLFEMTNPIREDRNDQEFECNSLINICHNTLHDKLSLLSFVVNEEICKLENDITDPNFEIKKKLKISTFIRKEILGKINLNSQIQFNLNRPVLDSLNCMENMQSLRNQRFTVSKRKTPGKYNQTVLEVLNKYLINNTINDFGSENKNNNEYSINKDNFNAVLCNNGKSYFKQEKTNEMIHNKSRDKIKTNLENRHKFSYKVPSIVFRYKIRQSSHKKKSCNIKSSKLLKSNKINSVLGRVNSQLKFLTYWQNLSKTIKNQNDNTNFIKKEKCNFINLQKKKAIQPLEHIKTCMRFNISIKLPKPKFATMHYESIQTEFCTFTYKFQTILMKQNLCHNYIIEKCDYKPFIIKYKVLNPKRIHFIVKRPFLTLIKYEYKLNVAEIIEIKYEQVLQVIRLYPSSKMTKTCDWTGDTQDVGRYSFSQMNLFDHSKLGFNTIVKNPGLKNHKYNTIGHEVSRNRFYRIYCRKLTTEKGSPLLLFDKFKSPLTDAKGYPIFVNGHAMLRFNKEGLPVSDSLGNKLYDKKGNIYSPNRHEKLYRIFVFRNVERHIEDLGIVYNPCKKVIKYKE